MKTQQCYSTSERNKPLFVVTCNLQVDFVSVQGFPSGSVIKNLPPKAGDAGNSGLVPGLGRLHGEGNGNPLQHSYLEIPWTEEPDGLESTVSGRV